MGLIPMSVSQSQRARPWTNGTEESIGDGIPCHCPDVSQENNSDCEPARNDSGDWRRIEADLMRGALGNLSSWWARVHYRATHSSRALGASLAVTSLLCALIVGVVTSGMWAERGRWDSIMGKQPLFFEAHSLRAQQSVPDAIRGQARTLSRIGRRERRIQFKDEIARDDIDSGSLTRYMPLDMVQFLKAQDSTELDSEHRQFVISSDEEFSDYVPSSSDESDLDYSVFSYNRRQGEWKGSALSVDASSGSWMRSLNFSFPSWRRRIAQPPKKSVNADMVHVHLLSSCSSSSESDLKL